MQTSTMWILFFVVVAAVLLIAGLSKTRFTTQKIAIIGIMAALSFVAYEFFRIPNVLGTGSSFHLGNTFTALTALLLDGVSIRSNQKLHAGQILRAAIPHIEPNENLVPVNLPFSIVYEDSDLIVLNKPAGKIGRAHV